MMTRATEPLHRQNSNHTTTSRKTQLVAEPLNSTQETVLTSEKLAIGNLKQNYENFEYFEDFSTQHLQCNQT